MEANGVRVLTAEVEAQDADEMLAIADQVRRLLGDGAAVVLGAATGDRATLIASLAPGAVDAGLSAVEVIRAVAPMVDGGGGGKPAMARAGGKNPAGLGEALARASEILVGGADGG